MSSRDDMEENKTLIFQRKDLLKQYFDKNINNIEICDFVGENYRQLHQANVVIFIDDNGETITLKNRYGAISKKKVDEDKTIEISITGYSGTGKTAFAVLFRDYLLTIGIKNINILDQDEGVELPKSEKIVECLDILRKRIEGVTIITKNKIRTINLRR